MRLSQLAPQPVRHAVWRAVELSIVPEARRAGRPADGPIVIAGMFTTGNGIGASARNAFEALRASGLEPLALDTSPMLGQGDIAWDGPLISSLPDTRRGMLLIYNNAPELGRILLYSGRRNRRDWFVSSLWAWETANRPAGWMERAVLADELWFPSRFVQSAMAPPSELPSLVAFHPAPDLPVGAPSAEPIVPPGAVMFTCYADALSSFTRKNPVGAVRAFKAAFGDSRHAQLIVKTRNASASPAGEVLREAISDAPNIRHIDRPFSSDEMLSLRCRTDVLVSLHRSEGFGLTISEAMRANTPVISTDWSAPSEYLDQSCAWLTPAREIEVVDPLGVYPDAGHIWADPDIEIAAHQMREAFESPELRTQKAEQARKRAAELFSPDAYRKAIGL